MIDLAVVRGRGGEMTTRTAAMASAAWLTLALLFGLALLLAGDAADAKAYFAGYLVETDGRAGHRRRTSSSSPIS